MGLGAAAAAATAGPGDALGGEGGGAQLPEQQGPGVSSGRPGGAGKGQGAAAPQRSPLGETPKALLATLSLACFAGLCSALACFAGCALELPCFEGCE